MNIRHGAAIILSGVTWMGIGMFLMIKGFTLILVPMTTQSQPVLLPYLHLWIGNMQQASLLWICLALLIGFIKGRVILRKTAERLMKRILALPNPSSLVSIYPRSYLILLALMMSLGMLLKWVPIPCDIKGLVDVAIGSALVNGSAFYFRHFAIPNKGI